LPSQFPAKGKLAGRTIPSIGNKEIMDINKPLVFRHLGRGRVIPVRKRGCIHLPMRRQEQLDNGLMSVLGGHTNRGCIIGQAGVGIDPIVPQKKMNHLRMALLAGYIKGGGPVLLGIIRINTWVL